MRKHVAGVIVVFAVAFLTLWASVASAYPNRPVRLVVAFRAGGSLDTTFRVFAKALGNELGVPVVVANQDGAGGAVGAGHLRMAPKDGYTLGANSSLAFTLSPNLGDTNYAIDDFVYIASIAQTQPAFVSSPKRGWETWQDMIEEAREKGSLTFASQTPWDRLAGKVIEEKEGISLEALPTKGGGEMVPMLLGGHVDFAWSGGIHYKYAVSGEMNVLAACTSTPLEAFPDVPTLKQLGYDISMDVPFLIAAPKGISQEVKETLEAAMERAFQDPELQDLLTERLKMPAVFMNSEQLTAGLYAAHEAYARLVKK